MLLSVSIQKVLLYYLLFFLVFSHYTSPDDKHVQVIIEIVATRLEISVLIVVHFNLRLLLLRFFNRWVVKNTAFKDNVHVILSFVICNLFENE